MRGPRVYLTISRKEKTPARPSILHIKQDAPGIHYIHAQCTRSIHAQMQHHFSLFPSSSFLYFVFLKNWSQSPPLFPPCHLTTLQSPMHTLRPHSNRTLQTQRPNTRPITPITPTPTPNMRPRGLRHHRQIPRTVFRRIRRTHRNIISRQTVSRSRRCNNRCSNSSIIRRNPR